MSWVLTLSAQEWRRFRFSPVWMIGAGAACVLAWSETGSSNVYGYPTPGQALYGFQLGSSVLFPLIGFILACSSLGDDIEPSRRDLLCSRPLHPLAYVLGKWVGAFSFTSAVLMIPLLLALVGPLFRGSLRVYDPVPFVKVIVCCTWPATAFCCALGIGLAACFRKMILTVPLFLLYFFAAALLPSSKAGPINFADFTMRLYPRELTIEVPLRLHDVTFSGLLEPLSDGLILRACMYAGLALAVLWAGSAFLRGSLVLELAQRVLIRLQGMSRTCSRLRKRTLGARIPTGRPSGANSRDQESSRTPGINPFRNELRLFWYSLKLVAGRNLVALALIGSGIIATVLTYSVGSFQTRAGVLVMQCELLAPLLGVIMFSDVVAVEFEARRSDLLRSSVRGAGWLLLRRLVHAGILTVLACAVILLFLRLSYTRFQLFHTIAVVLPGALFFGMLGLLAAAVARRSVVGYAVGAVAIVLWSMSDIVQPLSPSAYFVRERLANGSLLNEWNWILAKVVFVFVASLLASGVLFLAIKPERWRVIVAGSGLVVVLIHGSLHFLWAAPAANNGSSQTDELMVRETGRSRVVRRVQTVPSTRKGQPHTSTVLLDVRSSKKGEDWRVEQETPVDLTAEWAFPDLQLQAAVVPSKAALRVRAEFTLRRLTADAKQLLFYLAPELQITSVEIDGKKLDVLRHGELLEVPLRGELEAKTNYGVVLQYGGRLRLPQNLMFERASSDLLLVVSRWFPSLRGTEPGPRNLFTCRAKIRVPKGWRVAAASLVEEDARESTFQWESGTRVEAVPLCVGRFQETTAQCGDLPVSFCSFTADAYTASRILAEAVANLDRLQRMFGPFPYRRLAIVENRFQSAGGQAQPSLVLIKPERLAPEHQARFLAGYLGHELTHCWWGNAVPPWIAESAGVFGNYLCLRESKGTKEASSFQDREFYEPFFARDAQAAPLLNAQGAVLYGRGGYLLMMLANRFGSAAVLAAMRDFLSASGAGNRQDDALASAAFINQLKGVAGQEHCAFIDDWTGTVKQFDPALVSLRQKREGSEVWARIELEQRGDIRFPVTVRLHSAEGKAQDITWKGTESRGVLQVVVPSNLTGAEIDPEHSQLDWDRSNNRVQVGAEQPASAVSAKSTAKWRTHTQAEGLPDLDVRCLVRCSDGRLRVGVRSFQALVGRRWAVAEWDGERWQPYQPKAEPVHMATSITRQDDGSLWFASQAQLRCMLGDTPRDWLAGEIRMGGPIGRANFRINPNVSSPIPGSQIYTVLAAERNRIWVGTDHGLVVLEPTTDKAVVYRAEQGLAAQEVLALGRDVHAGMWAGTERGLFKLEGAVWKAISGFPTDLVLSIAIGPDGTVWSGTYRHGLVSVRDTTIRRHEPGEGLLPNTIISAVACDSKGRVWAGTPEGLLRFDGEGWALFTRANSGLPHDRVHCVVVDEKDKVWVGTSSGIAESLNL